MPNVLTAVIGLSIAAELIEAGLKVHIVARNLPTDLDSTDFCSPWAVRLSPSFSYR